MLEKVSIYNSMDRRSLKTKAELEGILKTYDVEITGEGETGDLIICIGGDGTLLRTLKALDFPETPVIGVNTGHLGFFQELEPKNVGRFIEQYKDGKYDIQKYNTAAAKVYSGGKEYEFHAMNEFVIRGENSVHLNISIGRSYLQKFSGDGVLICPPAGSTAYNYSLGGSIVDPSLKVLQITPMAPINTSAYRSFTSSVIVPEGKLIRIDPERVMGRTLIIVADGNVERFDFVDKIEVFLSRKVVNLVRLRGYDFWDVVKSKLLE